MKSSTPQDPLVVSTAVRNELGGISDVTLWRWERDGLLPPARRLNGRKYWLKSEIEAVKNAASQRGSAA